MAQMRTYLVESYAAGSSVPEQRKRAEQVAGTARGIRYIRTTIVPGDETLLHLFEATSSDLLREAVSVAALDCDRIVEVFETGGEGVRRGTRPDAAASAPLRRPRRRHGRPDPAHGDAR